MACYDIAIIGSGPSGLAVAARMREKTPSALFTNDEHARYWKRYNRQSNSLEKEVEKRKASKDSGYESAAKDVAREDSSGPSIVVLDAASDEWLTNWKQRFRDLKISQLRSPLFFHPDPRDRDGFLAFAHEQDRLDQLSEIRDVVGKELSKHEKKRQNTRKQARTTARHLRIDGRDQIDYYTPSTKLFENYCEHLVDRYHLRDLVQQAHITDICFDHGLFSIRTSANGALFSKVVIIASGVSSQPTVPGLQQLSTPAQTASGLTHVYQENGTNLPPNLHARLLNSTIPVTVMVIGGGLTSAQLCNVLLDRYYSCSDMHNIHIHLLLRHSKLKCKPFDVDLPWVSKTRNHLMSTFWSADTDNERLSMLRTARNGGSINAASAKLLSSREKSGRLTIHTNTILQLDKKCIWDPTKEVWTHLTIEGSGAQLDCSTSFPQGVDHIIFATGVAPSFPDIPYLKSLQNSHPIEHLGGLPVLTDDLAWSKEVPCFFTGALAALRLGPGAGNLMGARVGAERVAWAVDAALEKEESGGPNVTVASAGTKLHRASQVCEKGIGVDEEKEQNEFTGSFRNQFAVLRMNDDGAE